MPLNRLNIVPNYQNKKNQFGSLEVTEKTPIIELFSTNGINIRDTVITANSATVTNTVGTAEYILTSNTTANGVAELRSSERGRYIPGYNAEAGIGLRLSNATASDYSANQSIKWGLFDENNGFFFEFSSSGLRLGIRREGSDTYISRSAFNIDPLDGTGISGITVDLLKGNIFIIDFTWYGYGIASFKIIVFNESSKKQEIYTFHNFSPENQTSIITPNLPINIRVENGSGTIDNSVICYVAGRQYSIHGKYVPIFRITSDFVLGKGSIGTTLLPVITYRKKASYITASCKIQGYDILSDADALIEVVLDATLTDASYGSLNGIATTETALEKDTSATAISGGTTIYRALVNSSNGNNSGEDELRNLGLNLTEQVPITLAIRRITGTGGTVSAIFRVKEEW